MRMLSHDVLTNAVRVYELIQLAAQDVRSGNEAQARARLLRADSLVTSELPLLKGVLAAQTKAAEDLDLTQHTPFGRLPLRPRPEPQLHAPNDNHPPALDPTA